MEFSRPGDLIAPWFPIIFQLFSRAFSTRDLFDIIQASVGRWSINQVLKWHKMPPNRCFCSEHIVLAGRQHFITLWHYTHPNTFSNRYPLFRGNNIYGSFCHHYRCRFWCWIGEFSSSLLSSSALSVNAVNETPMKRSTAEELHLISFTLKMFFLHFLIRNCIDEFTLKTEGHQNIASNPSYRGISQTGSFAICSDFFFVSQIHIFNIGDIGVKKI